MKAGVITGDTAWALLDHAKKNGYAIPAINCTSASAVNSVLEAGNHLNRPVMVQFSEDSSAFFTGKGLATQESVPKAASILGAVAGAHYVRNVSPAYGIPVLVTSDRCTKASLSWLDGMLEADEAFHKEYSEPLFSSHMLDLSEEPLDENITSCSKYLEKISPMKIILEISLMGATKAGKPEDVLKAYQRLSPISDRFTISVAKTHLGLLASFQKCVPSKDKPLYFVLQGGSSAGEQDFATALSNGVVKTNVDADTQWAYMREAEVSMVSRVKKSCGYSKNVNEPIPGLSSLDENSWLTADERAALKATADAMSAPGKGFLASDESAGPWLRAGNSEAAKIPDTVELRAAYRAMLYQAPGLSQYISGIILHWETLFQADAQGNKMVDLITRNGMIPGIKLDKGYDKSGLPGTAVGPLGHPETWDKGIDDLEKRCKEAYAQGARFAKWRNVLQIDPAKNLPSELAVDVAVKNLAHYAVICQRCGLVPIVEPEIVPNGSHSIEVCAEVTERVLSLQFAALKLYGCYLEGAVLKPNMVKNGLTGPKAPPEVVAEKTIAVLKRTVPSAMPGIFFLSGETALDEDNEEVATLNLNAMNKMHPKLPWSVSFSYGKALQKTTIVTWMGKAENVSKAQQTLLNRSKANSEACKGTYVAGSCASVGTTNNAEQAAGPY